MDKTIDYENESFNFSEAIAKYIVDKYGLGWTIVKVDLQNNKIYLRKRRNNGLKT